VIAPQGRDEGGLGWLFQLVAVFVFFVLPVVRSIAESRKRGREGAAGKPPRPARKAGERSGAEQWRELLEGRETQAPPRRPAAPPPVPRPRVTVQVAPPPPPPPRSVPTAPAEAFATIAESAALGASFTPSTPELGAREIDPATLDDELAARWSEARAGTLGVRSSAAAALLGGQDWRSAIVLSEVLAPPLALRAPGAAWPGPPACLGA
jgi:hypothetical protein